MALNLWYNFVSRSDGSELFHYVDTQTVTQIFNTDERRRVRQSDF